MRIKLKPLVMIVAVSLCLSVFAIPDPGTLIIRTVNKDSGIPVGGIMVTVKMVSGDFAFDTLRDRTDIAGRLFVAAPPGVYKVSAQSSPGPGVTVGLASRAEVPVLLLVNKKP